VRTIAGAARVGHAERTVTLLAILVVAMLVVVLAVVVLRYIGSRSPKSDPEAAEAAAMAEADRRREAARRPTGGTGMWQ
jgi:type II secretory pathway pseudopilin PulG